MTKRTGSWTFDSGAMLASELLPGVMGIGESLERKIKEALRPVRLDVIDESHLHAGHAGSRPGGDSHFKVTIVASSFAGKSRLQRQRMVNALLADEFAAGLHALSLITLTPEEAARKYK